MAEPGDKTPEEPTIVPDAAPAETAAHDAVEPTAMAEPEPLVEQQPEPQAAPAWTTMAAPEPDFDDTVGFASSGALAGRAVQAPQTQAAPAPEPRFSTPEPLAMTEPQMTAPHIDPAPEADLLSQPPQSPQGDHPHADFAAAEPAMVAAAAPPPEAPIMSREARRRERDLAAAAPADDRMLWAYTVYALILFAIPTLGVSAAIGVLAVTGRAVKADELLKSHYIFQQRTLWSAAALALIGLVLIPIGLGVFVLFAVAVWAVVRGAMGVFRLKAGRPIENPRSWLL